MVNGSLVLLRSDGHLAWDAKPLLGGIVTVAQSWASPFYKSSRWEHTRKAYLESLLDTSGNVVLMSLRDGRTVFVRESDGAEVPERSVVPAGMCERCFRRGSLVPATPVHHINHLTPDNIDNYDVSLGFGNLQRLCPDCHAFVHSGQPEPRVMFDADGNPVERHESFAEQVMRLTESTDERRNIHSRKPTKEDR